MSRRQAKLEGKQFYLASTACKHGHVGLRRTSNYACVECEKTIHKEWQITWRENNKEQYDLARKKWAEINHKKHLESTKKWQVQNPEKYKLQQQMYQKNNKSKINAITAKRRAAKLQRTPSWLTKDHYAMIEIEYQLAAWCSKVMGFKYHVDHIVPLQGENVSGLHVPWNLQVIPAKQNHSKSNRFFN